ncbi:MAG: tyrosine--tRNA ligase [Candidatus Nealsonbacteria bacterium RIFCSPLOWO2_01_FULL_43_32]|uniref:Tyrosine--tRNA ligase n=1 Tax=Candidatus Nealsonbacteria bacterium RIFCSPLOWO2_01_FULL_43_32 TaxID=1801672 RepID=A0A1G2EE41_9BACT|nr:MAG: tyrosine--tRNA ligase [Candidatus Nealsonbacteria bacterium RIFCSPLOWO2_01_FULL_43_32]
MGKVNPKIKEALTRGVEHIYPSREALEKVLASGKKLRIYNGIDPTGKLHVGHLVVLRKLRQFQDLGHEIIILIGDFTATIGDPTGKGVARQPLSRSQVLKNTQDYKKQIGKILNFEKSNVKFLYNEKWSNKLKPVNLLKIFSHFTVARLLERDMFQRRIKGGRDILLHEFVYPVFQAYDSVVLEVDLEIGGNDQTFNMMRGRDLMEKMRNKEKFVMALKLLTDPTGKKMGKTEGNFISLGDNPGEMFGKIMSWPDSLLAVGFELLTDTSLSQVEEILKNPREAKARLAGGVVGLCHGPAAALAARKEFDKVFKGKELPSHIAGFSLKEKAINLVDLLVKTKLAPSRSEARRLVAQGGVKIGGKVQPDWRRVVCINKGEVIRVGKRKFLKII